MMALPRPPAPPPPSQLEGLKHPLLFVLFCPSWVKGNRLTGNCCPSFHRIGPLLVASSLLGSLSVSQPQLQVMERGRTLPEGGNICMHPVG